uniref:Ribosomal protein L6 n=1 Tax=Psammoneis japonica TaxID=517775 RepID=A0A2U9GJ50_9STRA|nr:ribosomal protein L6 [Psammoneis japonica]AWQ64265.1 ribosomal protein L6 [Psammoneis japonica]
MKQFSKKYIVKIPNDISIFYCNKKKIITFKGSRLYKSLKLKTKIYVSTLKKFIVVTKIPFLDMSNNRKKALKSIQGTTIALIKQIILEISVLLCSKLKFIGVGYRVFPIEVFNNQLLHLKLGYSHQIYFKVPKNLTISCVRLTNLFIFGNSYQYVNQIASTIRSYKLPEPYKGKGILYENEKITLKEGKKV